ncbi:MAG: alpha/beta fold hydrolase, partial [Sphaerochaetaceae bacterium]|nr:alpha/beta fold hydrolase [Sphaerochaetaceae bacterium]
MLYRRVLSAAAALAVVFFLMSSLISCAGGSYIPGQLADSGELTVPDQEGDSYFIMDDQTRLYRFSTGEGEPVLMIHGGPGVPFAGPWEGLEGIEGYQFHYYHQRGCGLSTIPFEGFNGSYPDNMKLLESRLGLAENLKDIERIRMILGVEKIILIGHSFGGFLAALYAAEYPERVSRMILVEPADMLRLPNAHGGMNQVEEYLPDELKKEYKAFTKEYFNFGRLFKRSEGELAGLNNGYARFYLAALEERYPGSTGSLVTGNPDYTGGFASFAMFFSLGRKYDLREEMKKIVS